MAIVVLLPSKLSVEVDNVIISVVNPMGTVSEVSVEVIANVGMVRLVSGVNAARLYEGDGENLSHVSSPLIRATQIMILDYHQTNLRKLND